MPKGFKKAYNNSVTKDKEENGKRKIARKHLCHRICTTLTSTWRRKAACDCELLYPSTILKTSQHKSIRKHTHMNNSYLFCVATCLNFLSRYGYACEDILAFPCLSRHMTKQNSIFGQNKRFSSLSLLHSCGHNPVLLDALQLSILFWGDFSL